MKIKSTLSIKLFSVFFLILIFSLSGDGCGGGGCSCSTQPDKPITQDKIMYDGLQMRVTSSGFDFVEQHLGDILNMFMPYGFSFPIPQQKVYDLCLDNLVGVPDLSSIGINCLVSVEVWLCIGDCEIQISVNSSQFSTSPPNVVDSKVWADIVSVGPIHIEPQLSCDISQSTLNTINNSGLLAMCGCSIFSPCDCSDIYNCFGVNDWLQNNFNCSIDIGIYNKPVEMLLALVTEEYLTKFLTLDIKDISFTLDSGDFQFGNICSFLDWGPIKSLLIDTIGNAVVDMTKGQITDAINKNLCMPCDYYSLGCQDGAHCRNQSDPMDPNSQCEVDQTITCVPKPLGSVGKMNISDSVQDVDFQTDVSLKYQIAPGQQLQTTVDPIIVNDGLEIRVLSGFEPDLSDCVQVTETPDFGVPQRPQLPDSLDFNGDGTIDQDEGYDAAILVAKQFLNYTLWSFYASGGLCLSVDTSSFDMLNTSMLSTLLPSLGEITHNNPSPMQIVLRPSQAPVLKIGSGIVEFTDQGPVTEDPLITIMLHGLSIDFYAVVEERMVRVLSTDQDIDIALSLATDIDSQTGQTVLIPVMPSNAIAVNNLQVTYSELLKEDPAQIQDSLNTLLGSVMSMLSGVINVQIPIPDLQGLKLVLDDNRIRGVATDGSANGPYDFIGVFARLDFVPQGQNPIILSSETEGSLKNIDYSTGKFPILLFKMWGKDREFSYRIDNSLWSPYVPFDVLKITSPLLALEGEHYIQIRSRYKGMPRSVDPTPLSFKITIDRTPPALTIRYSKDGKNLLINAKDNLTKEKEIKIKLVNKDRKEMMIENGRVEIKKLFNYFGKTDYLYVEAIDSSGNLTKKRINWYHGKSVINNKKLADQNSVHMGCNGANSITPIAAFLTILLILKKLSKGYKIKVIS